MPKNTMSTETQSQRGCGNRFTGQAIERRLCQSSLVIAL